MATCVSSYLLEKALAEYVAQGFLARFENGGTMIVLYHQNEEVARFLNSGIITADFIQGECFAHNLKCHGVII